jgi:two-component system chemotaxis response regulator CheY
MGTGEIVAEAIVVDDSRAVRMILGRILKEIGFQVREASNGRDALDLIAQNKAGLALVLADWNMPEMNGMELLQKIRQDPDLARLVVMMVTTETELDQMAAALAAGANEYVMKPFTKDILLQKLELVGIHP